MSRLEIRFEDDDSSLVIDNRYHWMNVSTNRNSIVREDEKNS